MKAVKIARLASPAVMAMRLPLISEILVGLRGVGAVDEGHRALLQRDADRLDRHAGADAAHHGGGVDVGDRAGGVGDELRDGGRAAAFQDLDVEALVLVEALVARDEERRVLAVQRPVQAERKFLGACALARGANAAATAAASKRNRPMRFIVMSSSLLLRLSN